MNIYREEIDVKVEGLGANLGAGGFWVTRLLCNELYNFYYKIRLFLCFQVIECRKKFHAQ